jgi:hypothetical protein
LSVSQNEVVSSDNANINTQQQPSNISNSIQQPVNDIMLNAPYVTSGTEATNSTGIETVSQEQQSPQQDVIPAVNKGSNSNESESDKLEDTQSPQEETNIGQ